MLKDFTLKMAASTVVMCVIGIPAIAASLEDWDVNDSSGIEAAEFERVFKDNGSFDRWDDDDNGSLTQMEIENGVGERQHAFNERYGDGWFKSWDGNSDSSLSEDEYYNGIYASYDVDGDKMIEETEFRALQEDVSNTGWYAS